MDKKLLLQAILFLLAVLFALVSYDPNPPRVQIIEEAKAKTVSSEVKIETKTKTKTEKKVEKKIEKKKECDANCKKKELVKIGLTKPLASQIVDSCKKFARDPVHCIKYAASVSTAESSGGDHCYQNGCFGIKSGGISYDTLADGVSDWVRRYNKYWYKATSPSDFYPPAGKVSKFRYCTAENSSGTKVGCPNGLKASSKTFTSLSQKF